ncbi:MAG TPA: 30S ribosomal protein S12 methylthiotransferase RimO [bacterium]
MTSSSSRSRLHNPKPTRTGPGRVHFISLGCAKNLVDSERLIGAMGKCGAVMAPRPADADTIIINTCGFIQPAVDETEQEIARALRHGGKSVYVYGCAVNRFAGALKKKFPEVTGWFSIEKKNDLLRSLASDTEESNVRCLTTRGYAYLKIADGCSNRCSYCTIPAIKGPFRSVPSETIVREARELVRLGANELILIGQDTTRYGLDLYGKPMLPELLAALSRIKQVRWLRIMYAHPASINNAVIDAIANNPRICKYLDLPIQHISDRVLRSMNRGVTRRQIETLLTRLERIKNIALRTTVMTGYPGETDKEFEELHAFLSLGHFDYVGVFPYCRESGTQASRLCQVLNDVIQTRYRRLLRLQQKLLTAANKRRLHMTWPVLVHDRDGNYIGHAEFNAPDVDSRILCRSKKMAFGRFYQLKLTALKGTDLYGRASKGNKA